VLGIVHASEPAIRFIVLKQSSKPVLLRRHSLLESLVIDKAGSAGVDGKADKLALFNLGSLLSFAKWRQDTSSHLRRIREQETCIGFPPMGSIAFLTDVGDGHPHRELARRDLDKGISASAHCGERITGYETAARDIKLSTIDDL
jgi:hypothetical protein